MIFLIEKPQKLHNTNSKQRFCIVLNAEAKVAYRKKKKFWWVFQQYALVSFLFFVKKVNSVQNYTRIITLVSLELVEDAN